MIPLLTDLLAAHGGVRPVEQGEGDSFVAAFARASDAVACALDLQRAPLAPIRLRIGVHTGQVQLRDEGNYIGPTINRTARLRDLAHGGQTVLSGATEQLVADWLPDDAWLTDLGSHELRDLPRPERVTQLCHPDLLNEFPPLRVTKSADKHSLPAQLTSFVGRVPQIAEIRALLADNRIVTLTGAGGAGKTRLAIQIAADVASEYRDGVSYVDLAPVTHEVVVPVAVARALGLPDQPGRSTMETLTKFVGDRQTLIVLDNCEHLLDAAASLAAELLAACPGLQMLATSRESTGVPGEVTFQVPSLSLADEAIELFVDRARRVRPDFTIAADNAPTVTEICKRLDGMPLAIELAAARVRALSLEEIVGSLHDRFRLLTGGARTAVRRQQTLRASVDWSHALLTETERILFRRLAVFLGGFDLDAAQAVAGDAEVERYQILDQLALLVDKSLVTAENTSGRTRYRLLETVRQYAQEKLGESGEAEAVRSRHRDHYTAMAALLDAPARSDYRHRVEQADDEMDNLRSAFGWSIETGDIAPGVGAGIVAAATVAVSRPHPGRAGLVRCRLSRTTTRSLSTSAPAVRARALADKAVLDALAGHLPRERCRTGPRDRARTRRSGTVGPSAHRLWQRLRIRRRRGRALLHRGDRHGPGPRRPVEADTDSEPAGSGGFRRRRPARRCVRPQKKDAISPTPSATASDRGNAVGGSPGALIFEGDLTGGDRRSMREVVAEAEADHDVMSRVTALLMSAACAGIPWRALGRPAAAAEAAIESATDLGDRLCGQ